MFEWMKSLFAWHCVRDQGIWSYWENRVTGQRKAYREAAPVMSPIDFDWLEGGTGRPLIVDVTGVHHL